MTFIRNKLTYTQIIALSFLLIIFVGSFLLCLPASSSSGNWTPFADSLFTATSATCVTGLVVYDTFTHWSFFGQAVILLLIQIGGLGIMTCIAMIALFMKKRISLGERRLLMQSAGTLQIGGVVVLIKRILMGTAILEVCGAVLLSAAFIPKMGFLSGLWCGIFTSISAFCNAGFDLMGRYGEFSSLAGSPFAFNPLVNITIMLLICIGGIGFIVWNDFVTHRFKFKDYEVHSKIALCASLALIVLGTVLFYIFERNYSLSGLSTGEKLISSVFQSVTPRTAGFNTLDLTKLSESGSVLMMILMFIGGSPGSTAGGIKTVTFVVLILSAFASARRRGGINVFKRRLDERTVMQASSIATVYMAAVLFAVMVMCAVENIPLREMAFEAVSAIGTVGLSMGLTPSLSSISHIILIILMYAGRVGGLTLMLVLAERRVNIPLERPSAKILIG